MIKVTVFKLEAEKLSLLPEPNSHESFPKNNLSQTTEFKSLLAKLDLIENIDYKVETSDSYIGSYSTIHFCGKSRVVRALWTIPTEMLYINKPNSEGVLDKAKLNYAIKLSILRKECAVQDMKFVEQALESVYTYIKDKVKEVFKFELKQTPVMEQLNKDLLLIDGLASDIIWKGQVAKYKLACASLAKAYQDEKANPSVFKKTWIFFNTPSNRLALCYEAILKHVCFIEDLDFVESVPRLIESYNKSTFYKTDKPIVAQAAALKK